MGVRHSGGKGLGLMHMGDLVVALPSMFPQIKMTKDEIINRDGLDSAVFLRIYILGLKIFGPIAIVALLDLNPINVSGGTLCFLSKELVIGNIDKPSISNTCRAIHNIRQECATCFWALNIRTEWNLFDTTENFSKTYIIGNDGSVSTSNDGFLMQNALNKSSRPSTSLTNIAAQYLQPIQPSISKWLVQKQASIANELTNLSLLDNGLPMKPVLQDRIGVLQPTALSVPFP
ncbi:hypothetical protein F0562_025679 [Nyssa sinensis]|uniref:CSC1/OSCA1-like N-terminal transmembrane domain-containing protein n=1 Tax=Nyssa sinensis TaxID=561372 RepID=A0A5J5BB53_9ASTE|nr:hypothetical protein F0562_025679 [Nyssa sinensis]